MKIITCASYYGSGSSAVTDLLSEFDDVLSLGESEYRFLQDPDGISDLEYSVIENNHRHNTSDSIKKYIKYSKSLGGFGYANTYNVFDGYFETYTNEFINEITELKVKTWWHKDRIDRGFLFSYIDRLYSIVKRLLLGKLKSESKFSILQNTEYGYYTSINEEKFLQAVRSYTRKLFTCVNKEDKPFVMVDQLVPPSNVMRYARYFDAIKIVVVDRDPRDIYLSEKEIWQWGVIPYKSVDDFVKWFKITRCCSRNICEDPSVVLRIKFEDLIFNYEETRKRILEFIGISSDSNCDKKSHFIPLESIKNTNLQRKYPQHKRDIEFIERELADYLYQFPNIQTE